MTEKPKPIFWIAVFIIISSLVGFSLYRTGKLFKLDSNNKQTHLNKDLLNIKFYSSSAKKEWINAMVKEFNDSKRQSGSKVIKINTFHVNSGESLDDMKSGKIKPDLWSPGDESWLNMAKAYFRDVKQKSVFDSYKPLVNIPLIIAIWEPMAKVLSYPNPIGWQDIEKLASHPEGWKNFGHPEWGKFRWGHAHPDANSGFLTIISEVYAALGKTKELTLEDLKKTEVAKFLKDFESAVEHYGLSNTWIDDIMHIKGPTYLSATVQYENTIIETNIKNKNKPFKMIGIYPKEGNFWTQHPIAVIKEDWMTPEKEVACNMFIDFLLSKNAQYKAMEMGLRPILKDIKLTTPFDQDHGVMPDINNDKMFEVPNEDILKRIKDIWEEVKIPATLILLLDTSGSMRGNPIEYAKQGSIQFLKNVKPRDQIMISVFNNLPSTLMNMCFMKDCGENAIEKLNGLFADGGTALYEAILSNYSILKNMKKKDPNRRYSLIVLSDGKDTSSQINYNDFLDHLPKGEDFDAPKIFTIAYGNEADKNLLAEIANRTNARLFTSSTDDIKKVYIELSANF